MWQARSAPSLTFTSKMQGRPSARTWNGGRLGGTEWAPAVAMEGAAHLVVDVADAGEVVEERGEDLQMASRERRARDPFRTVFRPSGVIELGSSPEELVVTSLSPLSFESSLFFRRG